MKSSFFQSYLFLITSFIVASGNSQANVEEKFAVNAQGKEQFVINICPISHKTPEKLRIENPSTDEDKFVDYDREVKDFGTDFINKEFFKSPDTLFNFLKLVYESIDQTVTKYRLQNKIGDDRAIFTIFKGGNVLRMLFNEFNSLLPQNAADLLTEVYADFFKRSDADFSVIIDEAKLSGNKPYDKVVNEIIAELYLAMNSIRKEFNDNPNKYFDLLQLDAEEGSAVLNKYFAQLGKMGAVKDQENPNWFGAQFGQLQIKDFSAKKQPECPYEGQYDYYYQFDRNDRSKIVGTPLTNKTNWIVNSVNRALEWPSATRELIKFFLLRAKAQFEFTFSKDKKIEKRPIGGELIDISLPHSKDFRLAKFVKNYERGIANYILTNEDTGESFVMKAESLDGLAEDLHSVLFEQTALPWDAAKYEKRINRLFFLFIIDIASRYGLGPEKKGLKYVNDINEKVIDVLTNLYQDKKTTINNDKALELQKNVARLAIDWQEMGKANHFFSAISNFVNKELIDNPKENDAEQFKAFLKIIEDNMKVLETITNMESDIIDISNIYNVKLKNLI